MHKQSFSLQAAVAGTNIVLLREGDAVPANCLVFDGIRCRCALPMGESDQILLGFYSFMEQLPDNRPLVVQNFWERLDEAIDRAPVLDTLKKAHRPVFLILPRSLD